MTNLLSIRPLISIVAATSVGFFSLAAAASVYAVESFGITPPYVNNQELEPGSVHEQRIFIVRRNASEAMQVNIEWDVPGADDWITLDPGHDFVIPAGEQKYPMTVTVTVPESVSAGSYQGRLQVAVQGVGGGEDSSGMIDVGLRARARVDLQVLSDGQNTQRGGQIASVFFTGFLSSWVWAGLALVVLLVLFVLFLRVKWLWRRIRKT